MRDRPPIGNGVGGGHESQARREHLVAGLDAGQPKAHVQRRRAVRYRHRMSYAGEGFKVPFDAVDIGPDRRNPAGVDAALSGETPLARNRWLFNASEVKRPSVARRGAPIAAEEQPNA